MSEKALRNCITENDLLSIVQNRREVIEKVVRNCTTKNDLLPIVQNRREVSEKAVRNCITKNSLQANTLSDTMQLQLPDNI